MDKHESWAKKVASLEAENAQLRRENERLREALRFLPPESFLICYGLLMEAVYLTQRPRPEGEVRKLRRHGSEIPVRNYKAYAFLHTVDGQLHRLKRRIIEFLNTER